MLLLLLPLLLLLVLLLLRQLLLPLLLRRLLARVAAMALGQRGRTSKSQPSRRRAAAGPQLSRSEDSRSASELHLWGVWRTCPSPPRANTKRRAVRILVRWNRCPSGRGGAFAS